MSIDRLERPGECVDTDRLPCWNHNVPTRSRSAVNMAEVEGSRWDVSAQPSLSLSCSRGEDQSVMTPLTNASLLCTHNVIQRLFQQPVTITQ